MLAELVYEDPRGLEDICPINVNHLHLDKNTRRKQLGPSLTLFASSSLLRRAQCRQE